MGNALFAGEKSASLTRFQKKKLRYDFKTFFDLNKDGCLTYSDFLWAKDKICYMSGWKIGSPKYNDTETLFREIWTTLEDIADVDKDGRITRKEWLFMWETYMKELPEKQKEEFHLFKKKTNKGGLSKSSASIITELNRDLQELKSNDKKRSLSEYDLSLDDEDPPFDEDDQERRWQNFLEETKLPMWFYKYLVFRFNLLDRTGDNVIDNEEFEYVLSEFGISEKVARQAYLIFTKNDSICLDFEYFVHLCAEYYLSDDPCDLGNFINGRLDYDSETSEDEDDPGKISPVESCKSFHSMDEDLFEENESKGMNLSYKPQGNTNNSRIRLGNYTKKQLLWEKTNCCRTS